MSRGLGALDVCDIGKAQVLFPDPILKSAEHCWLGQPPQRSSAEGPGREQAVLCPCRSGNERGLAQATSPSSQQL